MGLFSNMLKNNISNMKGNDNMKNNLVNNNNNKVNGGVNNMKTNKEVRMDKLQAAGVNTNKYFNINLNNIPVGAPVQVIIDGVEYNLTMGQAQSESSNQTLAFGTFNTSASFGITSEDDIANQILKDGYVRNTKLHRRWVMAQTFNMLNGATYNYNTRSYETGWDAYIRNGFTYMYQFEMTLEELRVLSILEKRDRETFEERSSFFTKEVVIELCNQYLRQLKKYAKNQKVRKCKGEHYVKLHKHGNVFNKDLYLKVYNPINNAIIAISASRNYEEIYNSFKAFIAVSPKLPHNTPKCPQWKDAFKGSGAFYTLKNMVMFHDVKLEGMSRDKSMDKLDSLLEEYKGEYWRFHMLLKKVIEDNNFNFQKSIELHKTL